MRDPITAKQFHDADGIDDWRVVSDGASAVYKAPSFAAGAAFAVTIATIADELDHHPDIDLRARSLTIRTRTHSTNSLTELDVALAQRIQVAAREAGLAADPTAVQTVFFAIDAPGSFAEVQPFWKAALGYKERAPHELQDPKRRGPLLWFNDKPYREGRNRIHVDVSVPHDLSEARVQAVLDAGGRLLGDRYAPAWWSLIDADGNVVDIATWRGRGDD
jgi:4a-hydroxytetrahydrobiopterin dehydratase